MKLYHGSNAVIEVPVPHANTNYGRKYFSWGFYCTELYSQAKEWAMNRAARSENCIAIVNIYHYTPDTNLNILKFSTESYEWLNFMAECRNGVQHAYDIVEGPVGDDQFWRYLGYLKSGAMTKKEVLELAKSRDKVTHQICFCNEKALKCLKFINYKEV